MEVGLAVANESETNERRKRDVTLTCCVREERRSCVESTCLTRGDRLSAGENPAGRATIHDATIHRRFSFTVFFLAVPFRPRTSCVLVAELYTLLRREEERTEDRWSLARAEFRKKKEKERKRKERRNRIESIAEGSLRQGVEKKPARGYRRARWIRGNCYRSGRFSIRLSARTTERGGTPMPRFSFPFSLTANDILYGLTTHNRAVVVLYPFQPGWWFAITLGNGVDVADFRRNAPPSRRSSPHHATRTIPLSSHRV